MPESHSCAHLLFSDQAMRRYANRNARAAGRKVANYRAGHGRQTFGRPARSRPPVPSAPYERVAARPMSLDKWYQPTELRWQGPVAAAASATATAPSAAHLREEAALAPEMTVTWLGTSSGEDAYRGVFLLALSAVLCPRCPGTSLSPAASRVKLRAAIKTQDWQQKLAATGTPTKRRNVSSILLKHGNGGFLVDAGEGTCTQVSPSGSPQRTGPWQFPSVLPELPLSRQAAKQPPPGGLSALHYPLRPACMCILTVLKGTCRGHSRTRPSLPMSCATPSSSQWLSSWLCGPSTCIWGAALYMRTF